MAEARVHAVLVVHAMTTPLIGVAIQCAYCGAFHDPGADVVQLDAPGAPLMVFCALGCAYRFLSAHARTDFRGLKGQLP